MNICRARNWMSNYVGWYFFKDSFKNKMYSEKETTLGSFVFHIFMAIAATICMSWNVLIIRIVYDHLQPLLDKKYVCDKYTEEQKTN